MLYSYKIVVALSFFIVASKAASLEENLTASAKGIGTKSVLENLAHNVMSRGFISTAAGGSQVISLNLTNLLILVLLKTLIFAAGSLGTSHYKAGYGRSADEQNTVFTEEEILLYLSYLTGDYGCLQKLACQQPEQVQKYVAAGEMLLDVSNVLQIDSGVKYKYILQQIQEAVNSGMSGKQCENFICSRKSTT